MNSITNRRLYAIAEISEGLCFQLRWVDVTTVDGTSGGTVDHNPVVARLLNFISFHVEARKLIRMNATAGALNQ